ncbi:MAG: PQQ-binding-like beta-propeller repeat protein [Vicinamibacterales bacterium]
MKNSQLSRRLALGGAMAVAAFALVFQFAGSLDAQQQLAAPAFTATQATAGEAVYKQSCASCHGAALDDGSFAPPLRGPEFRGIWFGRTADQLFEKIETMPPAAPGTLGADRHAELLAYIMSQNQLAAGDRPVPTDIAQLRNMLLPGFTGGPSGGLASGATIPPPPASAIRPNPLDRYTPVTDAMLQNPAPGEWLTWRRGYDSTGFSPLTQITKQNVGEMRAAWSWSLPNGPNEGTPLFHDGVLFVHAYGDKVQALDAATGDLLWQYSRRLPQGVNPSVKRAIGIYGDKVYTGTSDVHVVALDAKTGRVVWDKEVADRTRHGLTGGVTIAKGKVIVGTTGRQGGGNYIVAFDANTGEEVWRFGTIPKENEPGGNTWNGVPWDKRMGGSVWVPGAYDSQANLLYIGVAQTYDTGPYRDLVAGQNNDLLYTDATLALNPDTGALVWHFQHQPNDQWDYDWSFGRMVMTVNNQKVVGTGGKQAIFDFVDAQSGKYAFSFDMGVQDVVIGIDPVTGAKRINPRLIPGGGDTITTCPHAGGAKNWLPESYNPNSKLMFISIVEACMDIVPVAPGGRGSLSTGVRWTLRPRADSDGNYGRVEAFNLETRQSVWKARHRAPQSSGVLATAGGLVIAGGLDRVVRAYDDATGRELWQFKLNDVPNSAPISYEVNGRQYIALTVGNGGAQAATFPALVPEIRNPPDRGASIWVFELPNRAQNNTN